MGRVSKSVTFLYVVMSCLFPIYPYLQTRNWSPDLSPPHNCTCARPENLTDSEVLSAMYAQHPLLDVPLINGTGPLVITSAADMDFENFVSVIFKLY